MDRPSTSSAPAAGSPNVTMTSTSRPLRPYYVAPSPEEFLLGGDSRISGSTSAPSSSSSTGYSSVSSLLLEEARLATEEPLTLYSVLKNLASTGLLSYSSIACVMPFEVGKTLMQVQWIPKSDVELLNEDTEEELLEGISAAAGLERGDPFDEAAAAAGGRAEYEGGIRDIDQLSDEDDAQAYFHDLNANTQRAWSSQQGQDTYDAQNRPRSTRRRRTGDQPQQQQQQQRQAPSRPRLSAPRLSITRERDSSGYILRRSIFEKDLKPDWILPFTVTGGVWDMMKSIGRWKPEGWKGLWKGQLVTFIIETLSTTIQPLLYTFMASVLLRNTAFADLPLIHVPSPMKPFIVTLTSHVITSYLLSPLDLIRTRLIVQSAQPQYRKYKSIWTAYRTIRDEEGSGSSWTAFYGNGLLAFPTIIEATLRSFFNLGVPLFIERKLLLSTNTSNVVVYGLTEFTLSSLALLVTIPFETVKKRLHLQPLSSNQVTNVPSIKAYKPCVELRSTSYTGVTECLYRILTEETGRLYLHNPDQKVRRPSLSNSRRTTGLAGTPGGGASRSHSYRRPSASSTDGGGRGGGGGGGLHPPEQSGGGAASAATGSALDVDGSSLEEEGIFKPDMDKHPMPLFAGVTQLYRGLSMGVTANLIVFVLSLVAGRDDTGGWTEV